MGRGLSIALPIEPHFHYPESMADNHIEAKLTPTISSLLKRVQKLLTERKIEGYLVGGMVRDLVMGRPIMDVDIAVSGDALAIGKDIADSLCAICVMLDTENGITRLLPKGEEKGSWQLDVASIQGSLEEDLKRRDFTIDAIATALAGLKITRNSLSAEVYDPAGGLPDIEAKLIRAVSVDAFKNDPIRLLRGIRLCTELGFEIEPQTNMLIERDATLVTQSAGERIREELLRLFSLPCTYDAVVHMDRLGLLTAIIPEIAPMRKVDQPKEHTWNVFLHSAHSIDALDFILHEGKWEFAKPRVLSNIPLDQDIRDYFAGEVSHPSTHRVLTKLAALLHDVAKPQTRIVNEFGRVRFYGHPQEGAPIAAAILERLRFSTREIKFIETIVRYHLRPVQMTEDGAPPTPRAVYRYFRDLGDAAIATLYFSLADHLATRGPELEKDNWDWHVGIVRQLVEEHRKAPPTATAKRLLDGHGLQQEFSLHPGKQLGDILDELDEAQGAGEIISRDDALAYVKKLLVSGIPEPKHHSKPKMAAKPAPEAQAKPKDPRS
jgi:poly(A) polymerase